MPESSKGKKASDVATNPEDAAHKKALEQSFSASANQVVDDGKKGGGPVASEEAQHFAILSHLINIFESTSYDAAVASVVAVNVVLLIIETDCGGGGRPTPSWVILCNHLIIGTFFFELCIKLAIYRRSYFRSFYNLVDFTLVSLDVVSFILTMVIELPSLSMLRIVRLVRLGRSIQFLMMFPELGLMLTALFGTIKSLCWGAVLIAMVLVLCSILAVQLLNPINQEIAASGYYDGCERCPRAFESVWQSMLTFFQQLIAGDSWGTVSVPISEASPLAWLYQAFVLVCLNLLVLNVILAAVVDAAQQARGNNLEIIAKQKEEEKRAMQKDLLRLCQELDVDGSDSLTFQEVLDGFHNNIEFFHIMKAMAIDPEDIAFVWGILDSDGSGEVNYSEFCDELFKMKTKDTRTMVLFIKHYVSEIRTQLQSLMERTPPAESGEQSSSQEPKLQDTPNPSRCQSPEKANCTPMATKTELTPTLANMAEEALIKAEQNAKDPPLQDLSALKSDLTPELKQTLRLFEGKLEATNQLILKMNADIGRHMEAAMIEVARKDIQGSARGNELLQAYHSASGLCSGRISQSSVESLNGAETKIDRYWNCPPQPYSLATYPPTKGSLLAAKDAAPVPPVCCAYLSK